MAIFKGHPLQDTDRYEVVAHLINFYYEGDLRLAVQKTAAMLEGSYALGVICANEPDKLVCARKDSPLVVGIGENENFIASDFPAIIEYTKKSYILENGEIAEITKDNVKIYDEFGNRVSKEPYIVEWDVSQAEKAGYEHFMIKEIFEQPKALYDTLMPRIKGGRIDLSEDGDRRRPAHRHQEDNNRRMRNSCPRGICRQGRNRKTRENSRRGGYRL